MFIKYKIKRIFFKRKGFTLAEVLITLGIIGIVAALTLPSLIASYQKMVLRNQFKIAYNEVLNGAKLTTHLNGDSPLGCYYWDEVAKSKLCKETCSQRNKNGSCMKFTCADGSPLPTNINGISEDCILFNNILFGKALKVVSYCPQKALANGCLSENYHGTDEVQRSNGRNEDMIITEGFTTNNIKNNFPVWVLADGVIVIKWYGLSGWPIYAIDINGWKGPNKWGYDIFTFGFIGNTESGITKLVGNGYDYGCDKGGTRSYYIIQEAFGN